MGSILLSIKKLLGISEEDESFDQDLIIHINSVLMILSQLGVGEEGFYIEGPGEEWDDYLKDITKLELVKTYIYLKTKLVFDIPQSSATIDAIERRINEFEWRLNVAVDK